MWCVEFTHLTNLFDDSRKMPCLQAIGQCYPDYQFTPETFEKLYCSDKFPYDEKLKDWVRKLVHQSGIETIPSSINPEQFDKETIPYDPVGTF